MLSIQFLPGRHFFPFHQRIRSSSFLLSTSFQKIQMSVIGPYFL